METEKSASKNHPLLYDSLSRQLQPLTPADGQTFRIYCCGPTVYGPVHIGNFRTFALQDVLCRTLEASGLDVQHVRNITDVDDKTIRQSQTARQSLKAFTQKWTECFHRDCQSLNILTPYAEPRATDHIEHQIGLIERLIDKKHAYPTPEGSVYFRVKSFSKYGRLSHLNTRELQTQETNSAGERRDNDEYERGSIADFALWKARKPEDGETYWPSPWGPGRPGWHIECSAMALHYLGDTFDLHGGGVDLCFPHHENEIAQSECATGHQPFARHWFHTAHLLVEGQKMSKSLGNLYTVDDLQAIGFAPASLRYALIAGHYRQPLNFTFNGLRAAQSARTRLDRIAAALMQHVYKRSWTKDTFYSLQNATLDDNWGKFETAWLALKNDLNTPECLGNLFSVFNQFKTAPQKFTETDLRAFARLTYALGLDPFTVQNQDSTEKDIPLNIRQLAEERWQARQSKDWAQADALRDEIHANGWKVIDGKDGYNLEHL